MKSIIALFAVATVSASAFAAPAATSTFVSCSFKNELGTSGATIWGVKKSATRYESVGVTLSYNYTEGDVTTRLIVEGGVAALVLANGKLTPVPSAHNSFALRNIDGNESQVLSLTSISGIGVNGKNKKVEIVFNNGSYTFPEENCTVSL